MLSLYNISKTYTTKAKTQTHALKNINLDIPSCGMVFVLGKSGSGKSTLLNLLGGLDCPTSGEILVDGVSMKQFSKQDYNAYRNNYVGFIFQEFNLLADFNVRDNVALALKLTKDDNVNEKVSAVLKQVELNDSYLTRRIDEMSGGEKQRIAIARALIKNSKLILADEPTGNLDSATGESIWKLLKSLSGERLVVVVTHDRESAEKYADRIIEIADGQVVADNGEQSNIKNTDRYSSVTPTVTPSRLSFATRLKMGYNNLRLRKVKTISVILVAVFSMLSVLIAQMCLSFSSEVALADYIKQNDVGYILVAQAGPQYEGLPFSPESPQKLSYDTKQYVENNANYIVSSDGYGQIKSKQDILDFGLTFIGEALEIDDFSFYITSSALEECYNEGSGTVEVNGSYVPIVRESHPVEYLIGKKINVRSIPLKEACILAGVIDTSDIDGDYPILDYSVFPRCFVTKNFDAFAYGDYLLLNDGNETDAVMHFGDKQFESKMIIEGLDNLHLSYNEIILTADGIWDDEKDVKLAPNEIVLPYLIYSQLFGAKSRWDFISRDFQKVISVPKEIGQTFSLKFCEYGTGGIYEDYGEVKLAGVSFSDYDNDFALTHIITDSAFARRISRDLSAKTLLIQTSSIKNISNFLVTLRRDYNSGISKIGIVGTTETTPQGTDFKELSPEVYNFEVLINRMWPIFITIGAILIVILILLVINLISFSIANRKKEVGILSAIGASNKDITSIFLLETLIIAVISFVIVLSLTFAAMQYLNVLYSARETFSIVFPFMRVDILTVTSLIAMSFGLLLLAALIPIRKIMKLKPIDAIRNN